MQSIRTLLAGIIDYAGLFPPADLPLGVAAANYARYRHGPYAWMLGRFIIPAALLEEFAAVSTTLLADHPPWTLSALCSVPLAADLERIQAFHSRHLPARVDTIEIKGARPEEIRSTAQDAAKDFTAYFEIPLSSDPAAYMRAIAEVNGRAKLRTGGVTPESIPDSYAVARFVKACSDSDVSFKATAGLHHPLRGNHRLVPNHGSVRAPMHGFMNVFLASAFARIGASIEEIVALLHEESLSAFGFKDETVRWRDKEVTQALLLRVRQSFAIAFGSCSFEEPVHDLKALSLL
jgi:hypothetical protein